MYIKWNYKLLVGIQAIIINGYLKLLKSFNINNIIIRSSKY